MLPRLRIFHIAEPHNVGTLSVRVALAEQSNVVSTTPVRLLGHHYRKALSALSRRRRRAVPLFLFFSSFVCSRLQSLTVAVPRARL